MIYSSCWVIDMFKFRVFDKRYNTYLSPIKVGNMLWDALNSKDYILEQFTGLQDKNGKDIYVGDIVKEDNLLGVVVFDKDENIGSCGCCYDSFKGTGFIIERLNKHHYSRYGDLFDCEVIGNINENTEVLENE